ncbi:MAG: phospholipase D-like domain-containing protein [Gemmatimonadota bacterium]
MLDLLQLPWWALILMGVGILALGTLVLNLFSAIGDRPSAASLIESCALDSVDFLLALSGVINSPLHRGGTARLLNNGDEFVPAMLEAIRGAERSVNLTTYIWQGGEMSRAFFEVLTERARAGVRVRVLVDGFGAALAPRASIDAFRAAGGRWEFFNVPRFGKLTRMHKRTHRRALVVDGRIGFTGGAAVMDKWLGHAQDPDHWRDCMIEVRGRLALSLQSAFTQLWAHSTGELISGADFYPLHVHEPERDGNGEAVRRHLNIISSPSSEAHPMRHVFWFSIRSARERVYITNPYFVPDDILAAALKERARAGVDVRVLVPNKFTDLPLIRWASQSYYEELLEAGVRIYEYQPTMIHQKLFVADGVWSLVGSVNMDVRSKELNQENALGILDRGFAADLEATFFADLELAEEFDLDRWRGRPLHRRAVERFFRLFEEQL